LANQYIILSTCGHFEQNVLDAIQHDIEKEFHFPVQKNDCSLDIAKFYCPGRRQYDANGILGYLSEISPANAFKTLGLFRIDLYIPILTYIFGQALLNGHAGIISLYRLRNELYGLESNNDVLIYRFRKVIMHEMGHMFGLIHCHHPECVMRSSTYMEDIDQKEMKFCTACYTLLHQNIAASKQK